MKLKTTLILAIILALIAGYYYLFEVKRAKQVEERKEEAKKLFHYSSEEVSQLRLKGVEEVISCKKVSDEWRLEEPVQAKGNKEEIEQTIKNILDIEQERLIATEPDDLKQFGLSPPTAEVSFQVNGKWETLQVGDETPTGASLYAKKGDSNEVLLVNSLARSYLKKELYDLRDKTILPFELDRVKQFRYRTAQQDIICERTGENQWSLIQPLKTKADSDRTESFLRRLIDAKAKEFVEEDPKDLGQYQLAPPERELDFWLGEEKAQTTLFIGKKNEDKKSYYAQGVQSKAVVLLDEEVFKDLPEEIDGWRDKTIISFDRDKLTKINLTYEEYPIALEKKGDQWELTEPSKTKADNWEVESIATNLQGTKAEGFIDHPDKPDSWYGFDKPELEVSLWVEEEQAPQKLDVGKQQKDKTTYYTRSSQSPTIYLVKEEDIDKLKKTPFDLRDKVLISYNPNDLETLTIKLPEEEPIVIRKSGDNWVIKKPKKFRSKQQEAGSLVWEVTSVKMERIVEESHSDLSPYGLEPPKAEISFQLKKGAPLPLLLLGNKVEEENRIYCKLKDKPAVYEISSSCWDAINKITSPDK